MSFTVFKNICHDACVVVFIKQHHPDIINSRQPGALSRSEKFALLCEDGERKREPLARAFSRDSLR